MKTKMEEDTHEVNHVKNKRMKRKASVPTNKNSTLDNGSFEEVKKDKKKTKVQTEVEELLDGVDGKKNKKKKSKIVDESPNYAMESSKDGFGKKKKKKKLADDINQEETLQSPVKEEIAKDEIKGKKRKNKSKQTKAENIQKEEEERAEKDEVSKKRKKNILVANTGVTEDQSKEKKKKSMEEETSSAVVEITKPKKKLKVCENCVKIETPEGETEVEQVKNNNKKKKKKKKEAKTEEEEGGVGTPEDKENDRMRKVASCTNMNEDSMLNKTEDTITNGGTDEGKKGKKKGRKVSVEVSEVEEMQPKRKKRKKESKIKEDSLLVKCSKNEEDAQSRETTSKKKKISVQEKQVENDIRVESGAKKKKIKAEVEEQQEPPQVDAKRGNTDEVTIKQERRRPLQMEIDKASQPEATVKPLGLGQWSTAQFDSSAQQHKFLRLMGGFKKGFQPAAADTGKANTAMGKEAQQQLQQELIGEFERAQSRRMDFSNRGAGLGFTAPSKKKFSIDVNACRSVRFDD